MEISEFESDNELTDSSKEINTEEVFGSGSGSRSVDVDGGQSVDAGENNSKPFVLSFELLHRDVATHRPAHLYAGDIPPITTMSTRSVSSQSLGPLPPPVIPSVTQAMGLLKEELWNELQRSYQQNRALFESNQMLNAQLQATNAHCTLAQRALSQSQIELNNVKKKKQPRKSVKLRARFVTAPELKEDFEKAEVEWQEKERSEAAKQAKRKVDNEDDYITLAGALGISKDGTVEELKTRIREYLSDPSHADIAQNSRFAALFNASNKGKTCRARHPPVDQEPPPSLVQAAPPSASVGVPASPYPTIPPMDVHAHHQLPGPTHHFMPLQHNAYYSTNFNASQIASSSNLDTLSS
ncbi:hypothetical protein PAXRUDRAFT_20033 [Paxillus rubicundulus Ve08.2h10]|uniref:Uncharacterized protein n=1 Tax=Paxillus rubicundulus Ve08.2h10 TaxID=930991 RepID=A0A0D0DAP5_9AGAM|nr:hypothetical protein PAXRUDRAFT_20033 [Paxillus rubicundulus Ve08.2h10]